MSRKEFENYLKIVENRNMEDIIKYWHNNFLTMTDGFDKRTLLHNVAEYNDENLVQFMLNKGFNVDKTNKAGWSALHYAAWYNCDKVAQILLSNGANINLLSKDGSSALHYTAQFNSDKVAQILLSKGANINLLSRDGSSALHYAAQFNSDKVAQILLSKEANINLLSKAGSSALHYAVQFNSDKVAQILLSNGANINLVDKYGQTPLQFAQQNESKECISILTQFSIVNKDDVDAFQQINGNKGFKLNKEFINLINEMKPRKIITFISSLNIGDEEVSDAKLWKNVPLFQEINLFRSIKRTHSKMFEDSVSVDLINKEELLGDKCALQLAIDADSIIMMNEILKLLYEYNDVIERKLKINTENNSTMNNILNNRKVTLEQLYKKGYSRLDVAVADNSIKMLEYLLEKENNPEVISKALSIAMDYSNVECVQILTKYRADYNYTNNMGQSLLHSAVENRNTEIYSKLVDECTNFEKLDYLGLTALQRAVIYKEDSFVKEILRKDECWNMRVNFTKPKKSSIFAEDVDNINNIYFELWKKQFPHLIEQITSKENTVSLSVKAHYDRLETFSNYLTQNDVEFQDGIGNTILHTAVGNANKEMCYQIISISKEILGLQNLEGLSPLRLAVRKAMEIDSNKVAALDTVECLIKFGANLEQNEPDRLSILQEAIIKTDNEELLIQLLQTKETITALMEKEFYAIIEKQFYNIIPLLVKKLQKETVNEYLSKNVVTNLFDKEKYCLLMSIFRYLPDAVKSETINEYLFIAYKEKNENFFSNLCKTQNIEAKLINNKETIMTLLIENDEKMYFSYLIHGESARELVNHKNSTMNLPLHLVVRKKWYNQALLVIKYTENLDEENGDGVTPLTILIDELGNNISNVVEVGELLPLIYTLIDKKCSIYRISSISGRSSISYAGRYKRKIESYYEKHGTKIGDSPGGAVGNVKSTKQEEGHNNCFICDDRIVDRVLDCGHTFCNVCIEDLDRCPNCRETIIYPRKLFL